MKKGTKKRSRRYKKSLVCPKQTQIKIRKRMQSTWTLTEQKIYANALRLNLSNIDNPKQRQKLKIFKVIADLLQTRNSVQVKSHHQKLFKKFGDIQTIIEKVEHYVEKVENQQTKLKNLIEGSFQTSSIQQMKFQRKMDQLNNAQLQKWSFFLNEDDIMDHEIRIQIDDSLNQPFL